MSLLCCALSAAGYFYLTTYSIFHSAVVFHTGILGATLACSDLWFILLLGSGANVAPGEDFGRLLWTSGFQL
jgi:hypothetical protein